MKKQYMTPATEVMKMVISEQLMTVSSDKGIGYGGVDESGSLDPADRDDADDMWN